MTRTATFFEAWSSSTAYLAGDIVTSSGNAYLCISGHTNHTPPNATYWLPLSGTGGGGSTSPLTTKGDVWGYSTTDARIPVGSNDEVLIADSGQSLGVKWAKVGEAQIALADVTTDNVSSSAHGFAPKLPNDATKYLDGTGAYSTPAGSSGLPTDGWNSSSGWSYSSADAPTYVIATSSDLSGTIPVGARIKLTQTTVKYFIVTAISSTTITVYGGGNTSSPSYTLANASITSPYWSPAKVPFGFPVDPATWTYTVTDTSDRSQASPVNGTWYNLGSLSIAIPIGCWRVSYFALAESSRASAGACAIKTSLSTANNSESDSSMSTLNQTQSALVTAFNVAFRSRLLTLASKTTYFLNAEANATGHNQIDFRGDVFPTTITAECAYL